MRLPAGGVPSKGTRKEAGIPIISTLSGTTCRGLFLLVTAASGLIPGARAQPVPTVRLSIEPIKQPYKMCLVASVAMVLDYWGQEISAAEIERDIPVYKEGTTGLDLQRFVESRGFQGFLIQPELEDLFEHLAKGRPLIVSLPGRRGVDHALVLLGYSDSTVWLNDPATGTEVSRPLRSFEESWRKNRQWTFLILPK